MLIRACLFVVAILACACSSGNRTGTSGTPTTSAVKSTAAPRLTASAPNPGCLTTFGVSSTIPTDSPNDQVDMNCFAWQEFIALNWQASAATCAADPSVPASNFGKPNDTSPVVWETYKEAGEVFQAKAAAPSLSYPAYSSLARDSPALRRYK